MEFSLFYNLLLCSNFVLKLAFVLKKDQIDHCSIFLCTFYIFYPRNIDFNMKGSDLVKKINLVCMYLEVVK